MLSKTLLTLTKSSPLSAMLLAIMINGLTPNDAEALTGGDVFTKLSKDERYSYISGVVEGLGYARFVKDRPDQTGSECIHDWFFEGGTQRWDEIKQWFDHHKAKSAGVILYAMISKECGQ